MGTAASASAAAAPAAMVRLGLLIYSLAATVLVGTGMTFVLVMGWVALMPLLLAAGAGLVLAIPVGANQPMADG